MIRRNRILRQSASVRSLVRETALQPTDFIVPVFITEGENRKVEVHSMPGYFRYSLDLAIKELEECYALGLRCALIFVKVPDELKDNLGKEALNENGLMQRSVRAIKNALPDMVVITDVALDPYSSFGHDGIVEDQQIVNDKSVAVLARMSVSHAKAGADFVAPSDMMDGRILAIREALEKEGFHNTGIMSYAAKYASCFYGPFRDALDSAPGFGDKKTYQMDPANRLEAIKEVKMDVEEGADIIMVKPAHTYLDIIREVKNEVNIPVSAYHVSGEYAMIKAAAKAGFLNEEQAIIEVLTAIKRAGADLIATYFAKQFAQLIQKNK
ncbi:MAG: porphobilinogen synthase [Bacteroidia bacterium]|nr:porphobilinogen synthase [Bacteroidia bacterium]